MTSCSFPTVRAKRRYKECRELYRLRLEQQSIAFNSVPVLFLSRSLLPMRRSFTEVLRQESPLSLARDAAWSSRKSCHRNRSVPRVDEDPCLVVFRMAHYYVSDIVLVE